MRLDKYLCDTGLGTRSEMRAAVAMGRVTVDGRTVRDPGMAVAQGQAVCLDARPVAYTPFDYLMMHKPAGVVSVTEDPKQKTVLHLLPPFYQSRGLFPAGRLDKDTTGFLLLTNDGDFAHRITSPRRHAEKRYAVTLERPCTPEDIAAFAGGLTLRSGEVFRPAGLEISEDPRRVAVILSEGKYHQIKRMFAARDNVATALHRLSMGGVWLDESLAPGGFRPLTEAELASLRVF